MNQTPPHWQGELPEGWLLVTVDRLPAWMLSPFGATWASNPTLCQLASAGLTCDRVLAGTIDSTQTLRELAMGHATDWQDTAAGPLAAAEARGWNVDSRHRCRGAILRPRVKVFKSECCSCCTSTFVGDS